MVHIVLVEPEIPQNCGNIARTCAATGCDLHLIRPLGFDISDRAVKRAGLDYWHLVRVFDYESLDDFFRKHPEAAGLPEAFRTAHYDRCIRLPMVSPARSLNLSNSVAVLTYEALRQQEFPGLMRCGEMAK